MKKNKNFLSEINYNLASDFQHYISDKTSKKTSNNILGALSLFFDWLVACEIVTKNYFSHQSLTRYKIPNFTNKRNFEDYEISKLFSCKNIKKEVLNVFNFLLFTGIRLEEFVILIKIALILKAGF